MVGRPRPDFAYRCWPNSGGKPWTTQEDSIFTKREPQDLHCHGDVKKITEGRKSFPSGHSSFSFAVFGFMFLYLSAKLRIYSRKQHVSSFGSADLNWIWRFLFSVSILLGTSYSLLNITSCQCLLVLQSRSIVQNFSKVVRYHTTLLRFLAMLLPCKTI